MADNTAQTGSAVIRAKDRSGVETQIVGLDLGIGTGTENLMAGSMPVTGGQTNPGSLSTSFTFTAVDAAVAAPDGTGTLISGTPTAGSMSPAFTVADGLVASVFLVKGLTANQTTQTVYFEGSRNSTNGTDGDWVELKQRRTGTQPGVETADYKTQSNGYFRGNCAGFTWLRARLLGTFAAGASVQIATSAGQGATFLNSGLPGGSSTIGNVGLVAGSAAIGSVTVTSAPTTAVTGTFFQATQPVSATSLPLPTGASTETTLAALSTKLPTAAAAADALANPTLTQINSFNQLFNGTSWDRQRGMSLATTTGDTGAKTATGTGATQTNTGNKGASIFIILGVVLGTTPTAVFKVQGSVDGTNFFDIPGATTASLTASTNVGIQVFPGIATVAGVVTTGTTAAASQALPRFWRLAWTIGGTLPSFTITSITYNYLPY